MRLPRIFVLEPISSLIISLIYYKRYLNLLQAVKGIIIVNKIKSYLGMASEAAFYQGSHV